MTNGQRALSSMRTVGVFMNGRACSDTLFHVLCDAYGYPMTTEERATMPFAGGILQHGYQCGMLWGSSLAAGAQAYRLFGPGPHAQAKAIVAAKRVVESFQALVGHTNCLEITETSKSSSTLQMMVYFLLKGGTIRCFRMAARYAPIAFEAIKAAFEAEDGEVPAAPVSCAAMVAQKLGASDEQAVMAAALAGGIGLSGGACGALGAAIWILGMRSLKDGATKIDYKAPMALELIEKFLKSSDYEFECSKIVGRQFESVSDHACYLCNGGCSKIMEALAGE